MLKRIQNLCTKSLSNNSGMSIIEVLVAVGLMSIASIGVITMMQNSSIDQKKNVLLSTLREQKLRIENIIRDQGAWSKTMNGSLNTSALWTNLKANTNASTIAYTAPEKVVLYDAAGNVAYNLLDFSATSGNGFTEGGVPCTSFTTSGNDACPISYRIVLSADCGGPASCLNPQLKIVGRLVFSPSSTGVLYRFVNLVSQVSTATIADGAANEGKYDAVVKRTATQVNSIFAIKSSKSVNGALSGTPPSNCASNGGGQCTTGATPGIHPSTLGTTAATGLWQETNDSSNLVTIGAAGTGGFTIDQPGTYDCKASITAFGTTVTGYLYRGTTKLTQASAAAGKWGSGTALMQARFEHPSANLTDVFTVQQNCNAVAADTGTPDANIGFCSLGYETQPYTTATDFVTVECTRVTDPTQ